MSADLWWLTATLLLAGAMWVPYTVGSNLHMPAGADPFRRPMDKRALPDWVQRADRAQGNLLEQGMPFAALVLTAHAAGASGGLTAWAAAAFFAVRLAHAAGMIAGVARNPLRPTLFTAGWLCHLAVAAAIFAAA